MPAMTTAMVLAIAAFALALPCDESAANQAGTQPDNTSPDAA
jgi:hypothetical protein